MFRYFRIQFEECYNIHRNKKVLPSSSHAEWNCIFVKSAKSNIRHDWAHTVNKLRESHRKLPPMDNGHGACKHQTHDHICQLKHNSMWCSRHTKIHFIKQDKKNRICSSQERWKKTNVLNFCWCLEKHNWGSKSKILCLAHIPFTQVRNSVSRTFLKRKKVSKIWMCPDLKKTRKNYGLFWGWKHQNQLLSSFSAIKKVVISTPLHLLNNLAEDCLEYCNLHKI